MFVFTFLNYNASRVMKKATIMEYNNTFHIKNRTVLVWFDDDRHIENNCVALASKSNMVILIITWNLNKPNSYYAF